MIVTIDGPAGAGKSSAARSLARRLGFRFLDTGAMYRAVALAALKRDHDWSQPEELVALARRIKLELDDDRVFLDGADVSEAIREIAVTSATHYAADNPGVRQILVELQRTIAGSQNVVSEGRDQGTVVFPHAPCKIFLTATPQERARRRLEELTARGEHVTFEEIMSQQEIRDYRDSTRPYGPLKQAEDAIEMLTDGLSADEVVDRLENLVRSRLTPDP